MNRVPFGIRRLDTTIDGGAPPGSVVLLSGEAGAGAREFMYTCAMLNGLLETDPELFRLYYGSVDENVSVAEEVHYISFTSKKRQVAREMSLAMDEEVVESSIENVRFHDLSPELFRLSPVPREWYADRTTSITDLGESNDRKGVAEELGNRLTQHAPGNLVVIDSVTDLISTSTGDLTWDEVPILLKGLTRAASEWGGLIIAHVNRETLEKTQHGQLMDAVDGTLLFEWESGGSSRARTMVVKEFRGVLSQIEAENIVRFETEIGDAGFDISDVRKIR